MQGVPVPFNGNGITQSMSFGENPRSFGDRSSFNSIPSGLTVADLLVQSSASAELEIGDVDAMLEHYMLDLEEDVRRNSMNISDTTRHPVPGHWSSAVSPGNAPQMATVPLVMPAPLRSEADVLASLLNPSPPASLRGNAFPNMQTTPFAAPAANAGHAATILTAHAQTDVPPTHPTPLGPLDGPLTPPLGDKPWNTSAGSVTGMAQQGPPCRLDSTVTTLSPSSSQGLITDGGWLGQPPVSGGEAGGSGAQGLQQQRTPAKRSQEKNRRAQQRFRDRQKARVAELETQVGTLQARVTRLLQQHAETESRLECMSRVLKLKEDELQRLRRVVNPVTAEDDTKAAGEDPLTGLVHAFNDSLTLTLREEHPVTLTPEDVKSLRREQLCALWREYVNQLSVALVDIHQTHEPSDGPAHQRISRLVDELCLIGMRVAMSNPQAFRMFVACSMEDGSMLPCEDRSRWLDVGRSLGLSLEQRVQLRQLRMVVLERLEEIQQRRSLTHEVLLRDATRMRGAIEEARSLLATHAALDEIRASLREEMVLKLDFTSTLYKHLLLPVQVAKLMVKAYPYSPDNMSICAWVAAEDGDPQALQAVMPSGAPAAPGIPGQNGAASASRLPDAERPMAGIAIERASSTTRVVCLPSQQQPMAPLPPGNAMAPPSSQLQQSGPTITTGLL